nr:hypothetical protein [Bacillus altitudinis]
MDEGDERLLREVFVKKEKEMMVVMFRDIVDVVVNGSMLWSEKWEWVLKRVALVLNGMNGSCCRGMKKDTFGDMRWKCDGEIDELWCW